MHYLCLPAREAVKGGESRQRPKGFLGAEKDERIEAIMVSHPDSAHTVSSWIFIEDRWKEVSQFHQS